ncbi:hypothetical protein ATANTOWER_028733 [Ataeniobius toweri]|uniref:Uncharacterized protein n=1 Tax=Ataeniobius toweri TaxID=208326 RepID=A0ABU7AWV1_9TELE|nr:hypothetical protein [Ataeniobius toweri]
MPVSPACFCFVPASSTPVHEDKWGSAEQQRVVDPIVLEELSSRCSKGLEADPSPAPNYHLNDNTAQINSSQSQFEDRR